MIIFSCLNHVSQQLLEQHIFQKIAEVCPPPSKKCRVVALQNYGALQLLELHEVSTSSRCLLPVRLRDLYVSLVVWICTYDPSSLFQKNKTVTVMWLPLGSSPPDLVSPWILALWIRSLVLLRSPWSGSAAWGWMFLISGATETQELNQIQIVGTQDYRFERREYFRRTGKEY